MKVLFAGMAVGATRGLPMLPSFQQADADLLRDLGHDVRILTWRGTRAVRLLREARRADLVYAWHIDYHSFIASLAARKLACVIGGYEFANLPEYGYGNMTSRRMRTVTRRVWQAADVLLYVDPSLMDEATAAFGHPGRAVYLPTGYDDAFWTPPESGRSDAVATVFHATTMNRWRLKGGDLFLDAARMNPDLDFHFVGDIPAPVRNRPLPRNVKAHGFLDRDRVREIYRRSKVYCQLSRHEGLPNAVCEAMLCGCIPVGTAVNGTPRAIGDAGFLVDRTVDAVTEAIRRAMDRDQLGSRARERIARLFPLAARRRGLADLLERLLEDGDVSDIRPSDPHIPR